MSETRRVLVLGQGTRAFLSVIRSLGRLGLEVHVGMCPEDDLALHSRHVARRHEIPPHRMGTTDWLDAILGIVRREPFALVIPCDDQCVIPIQLFRADLEPHVAVYAHDPETYRLAFDKIESTRLAEELGLRVAKQQTLDGSETAQDLLERFELPVVLKPPSSFEARDLTHRREVVRVRTASELGARLDDFRRYGSALIQENFNGTGVGVELIACAGEVLSAFQHERVHEPLEGGGSSYRRSVELTPELADAAGKLMRALDYTGVAMIEFKVNPRSGDWIFIEINGRFWGSLPLALAAGADFPAYLFRMLVDGEREFPTAYRVGIHCRSLIADFYWLGTNLRADHSDPTLATLPAWRVVAELRNVVLLRERIDTLTLDDPMPAVHECLALARRVARKVWSTLAEGFASPPFVRRLRARRIAGTVAEARSVLFLCYGNICRSPFAAEYATRVLGDGVVIASSGVHPEGGRASPPMACAAARRFGIDLSRHRSSVLDRDAVDATDVIFVFDDKNRRRFIADYPDAEEKLVLLGDLAPRGSTTIDDPYGGSEAQFLATYEQIRSAVAVLER